MNGCNLPCSIKEINFLGMFSFWLVCFSPKKSLFCFFCKEIELFLKKICCFPFSKNYTGF